MKRIFIGIFLVISLAITALVAVAMLTPKDVYKARIEAAAAGALGREVALKGDVGLSFFPRIAASVEDVTVANPEGFTEEHMIKAGALRASVKWGPLFTGRVEVQEIAFIDANVDLEVLADGRANWEFDTGETKAQEEADQPKEINAGVDRARLVNAALTYRDGVAGTSYTLTDLNIEASVTSLTEALNAAGNGVFEGDAFSFDLRLDSPQAVIDGNQASADLTFRMDLIEASFKGTATLNDTPSLAGDFTANAANIKALADYAGIDPASLPVALGPLGGITAAGNVNGPLDTLALDFTTLKISGDGLDMTYLGQATLTETPSVNGQLTLGLDNAAATVKALGLEIPEAATLDRAKLNLSLKLDGAADALSARAIDLSIDGPLLNADYTGAATIGTATTLDGSLALNATDLHALIMASGIALEPSQTDPLKGASLNLKTVLKGPAETLSASDIDFNLTGPLLNAAYQGDVSLAGSGSVNGQFRANSDSLRALLAAAKIEMAPGETFQVFRVSGATSGAFNRLSINNLDLAVDDMTGKGNLNVRTDTARPLISGNLTTGPLDLTPLMGATPKNQPPEKQTKGWSKEPLALESLAIMDADITLISPAITIDNIKLSDANLAVKLINGVLDTNINQFKVFGGLWKGGIDLNTAGATPTLSIAMTGDSILMQDIMKAFVGNDALTGSGQFKLDINARGNSLDAIMKSMNGELAANLADGELKGVNISQLIRSASDLRSALASGSGLQLALSPSASSDFSSFNSVLKIQNGVANIELMEMLSSTFGANGLGQINLGGQTMDMALRIAADKTGRGELVDVQVNNVGIPLRITGDWAAPRIVPDTSVLTQMLAGKALDRFGNLVGNAAGNTPTQDAVTGVLSGVLGNRLNGRPVPPPAGQTPANTSPAGQQPPADPTTSPSEKEEPATVEEAAEDLAKEALGNLFGRRKKDR